MPTPPKDKSTHLHDLEAVFDRHTRRFSPFAVLGLSAPAQETGNAHVAEDDAAYTSMGVDGTHPHVPPTPMEEGGTPIPGMGIHTRVVVSKNTTTNDGASTHMGVGATHPQSAPISAASPERRFHEVLAATQLRAQLGKKARQVLGYLNSLRSIDTPAYTVPVGYAHISAAADVHAHYLRRNVLPKLAMMGLIGIVHKSFQGTIYSFHYDAAFVHLVAGEDAAPPTLALPDTSLSTPALSPSLPEPAVALPSWIDREPWGWLTPELVGQLVAKAGSEAQAQEKLAIILYNETHGDVARRVRDRRAVLAHYLRTPHADLWPNDEGFETLALRQARQERDRALHEKALAEEALRARQDAARARFLAALVDTQLQWLKQEAKRRVDSQPSARFLTSRYPLYKAEEEQLMQEWRERGDYGESVPHARPERREETEETRTPP